MLLKYLFTYNTLKHKTYFKIFAKTPTCFGHNLTILTEYKNSCNEVATTFLPVVWRHACRHAATPPEEK